MFLLIIPIRQKDGLLYLMGKSMLSKCRLELFLMHKIHTKMPLMLHGGSINLIKKMMP